MQRKCKRFSCVLIIIILSQLLCTSASAEEYSGYQEVPVDSYESFYNAVIGNWYNVDNSYGAQCWDGASLFWMQVKGERLTTGSHHAAKDCWNESRDYNAGDHFYLITDVSKILKGDVIVFGAGSTGHICFADEDYVEGMTSINVLGQNQTNASFTYGHAFDVVSYDLDSFLGAFRYIGWADRTAPTFGRTVDISNIYSKGFTASCHIEDNREITSVWAVAWPVEETDRKSTFPGTYNADTKTASFVIDNETIGYLGHGYSFTAYAEDKTGNVGMLTPITGISLYKMDVSENGTYKALENAKVYIAPYEYFNGISTHAYTLEKGQQKDVIGSFTENGVKYYRLDIGGYGSDQWVRASDMTRISAWESLWNSIKAVLAGNQTQAYVLDENTVYTCSDSDTITIAGAYSYELTNLNKGDPTASDPEAVKIDEESFPNSSFRYYIIDNFDIDKNGELSPEELNAVKTIIISGGYSAKGIEHFSNLTSLSVGQNASLTQLDLTQNTALEILECYDQPLQSLDLRCNTRLQRLVCTGASFNNLDLSQNAELVTLNCSRSALTSLDLSGTPSLESLTCDNCGLETLDLSYNHNLVYLNCCDNKSLSNLNISKCAKLEELWCRFCHISAIDVSHNPLLSEFWCCGNLLTSLDISLNSNLGHLYCVGNQLSSLDVSHNPLLWGLSCGGNLLSELDVSQNAELTDLSCFGNQLRFLDLSHNTKLARLRAYENQMTSLDLTKNVQLDYANGNVMIYGNGTEVSNYFDLNLLPAFDITKVYNLTGGILFDHYLVFLEGTATYDYQCSDQFKISFYLKNSSSTIASGICGDNLNWLLDDAGVLTISGEGAMYDYTDSNAAPWRGFAEIIKVVVIKNGATSIGAMAFEDFRIADGKIAGYPLLTHVSIPSTVSSIGGSAFAYCSAIESITLPEGIIAINDQCFLGCTKLATVSLPSTLTAIETSAFHFCTSLSDITIPQGVTKIGYQAFLGCTDLTSIAIPNTVERIETGAFDGCGLSYVYIPASVSWIGVSAFSSCPNLEEITVNYDNGNYCSQNGVLFSEDMSSLYCYPAGKSGSYYIPDGVTSIMHSAFNGAVGLSSVSIPDSVTNIEPFAFGSCTGLEEIKLPDSVNNLNGSAFSGCTGLTRVKLSSILTMIGYEAFRDCTNLADISIPVSITKVGADAFRNCTSLKDVYYGGTKGQWDAIEYLNGIGATVDGNAPLRNANIHYQTSFYTVSYDANGGYGAPESQIKTPGKSLTLTETAPNRTGFYFIGWAESPNTVEPDYARPGGTFTHDVDTVLYAVWAQPDFVLPAAITEIGEEAFAGGTFRFAELPKRAVTIGPRAFADCQNLHYIYIYDEVTEISADAFGDKESLTIFGVGPYRGEKSIAQKYAEARGFTFIPLSSRVQIIVTPSTPYILADP